MKVSCLEQQNLINFMPDSIKKLTPDQLDNYNFLQGKLRQYKQLRRTAADKKSVDNIIDAYRLEVKKLLEGS